VANIYNRRVTDFLLPLIASDQKTLEVCLGRRNKRRVKVGDIIEFNGKVQKRVTAIREYPDFDVMMEKENAELICPGAGAEKILGWLKQKHKPWSIQNYGVLVFELQPLAEESAETHQIQEACNAES